MRIAFLAVLLSLALPLSASAADRTVWLCKPGKADNPCVSGLTATVLDRAGAETSQVERTRRARRPRVDCFYVYPTISTQQTINSNLRIEVQQRAVATIQASRFSQTCRIWAPMYRQVTLTALRRGEFTPAAVRAAYTSLRSGWRDYLRNHNRGRGVVFLSHSQGTIILRRLIREEVEPRAAVRRRLVSALLLGGGVTVRRGSTTGGDFRRVRACRSARQLGCVIGYSSFDQAPPEDAVFGRSSDPELEVLCTNPAALGGGSGTLRAYIPTQLRGFAEPITGPLPEVSTPWLAQPDGYGARCEQDADGSWLEIRPLPGGRELTAGDLRWGLHNADMNLPLGNLTGIVRRQVSEYFRRR